MPSSVKPKSSQIYDSLISAIRPSSSCLHYLYRIPINSFHIFHMIYLGHKQVKSTLTNMYYYHGKKQTESIQAYIPLHFKNRKVALYCRKRSSWKQRSFGINLLEQWTCLLPARPDLLLDLLPPRPCLQNKF